MLRKMADGGNIVFALQTVRENMKTAFANRKQGVGNVELIAVSKTKPVELIAEAYHAGQRHFGENYVQELFQKSQDPQITSSCPDIRWHFIGHLQSGKINKLVGIPNLVEVETIDSIKLAETLNRSYVKKYASRVLDVKLEVNTSRESNKHGFKTEEIIKAVSFIRNECKSLRLTGLMTIGSATNSASIRPNPDFQALFQCRQNLCAELQLDPAELELSMGMSEDYEHAIEMGSNQIRVGSKIFGSRVYESVIPDKPSDDESA